jgi:hypothetical protein
MRLIDDVSKYVPEIGDSNVIVFKDDIRLINKPYKIMVRGPYKAIIFKRKEKVILDKKLNRVIIPMHYIKKLVDGEFIINIGIYIADSISDMSNNLNVLRSKMVKSIIIKRGIFEYNITINDISLLDNVAYIRRLLHSILSSMKNICSYTLYGNYEKY